MRRYKERGVSFELPPDWSDRTIVAFQAPPSPERSQAPNIVVTKEPMRQGDTLRVHADRQMLELGRVLSEFDLLESRETELGGRPAIYVRFAWLSAEGPIEQSFTMVERQEDVGRAVTTFTTSAPRDQAEAARLVFGRVLASVEFDAPAPEPRGSAPPSSGIAPKPDSPVPDIPMPGFRSARR